jgi:hypothetical protein
MDPALRLISRIKNSVVDDEAQARSAWKRTVGARIEAHARFRGLVRQRLVIEVDDKIWQSQLYSLEKQILNKLERVLGRPVVTQIEFQLAIPRLGPQVERGGDFVLEAPMPKDKSAQGIQDPILRRNYLNSKRRASSE